MPINTIKRHSTYPALAFSFLNEDGVPVDCSPFEVRLVIRNRRNTIIVDKIVGAEDSNAIWTDELMGEGEYQWAEGDTAAAGRYKYEFKFKRLFDNKKFTLPEDGQLEYLVLEDIA